MGLTTIISKKINANSLEGEEERTGARDEEYGQVENAWMWCSHKISITEEFISSRKDLPLPRDTRIRRHGPAQQIHLLRESVILWCLLAISHWLCPRNL